MSSVYIPRNMGTSADLFRFSFTMFRHNGRKKKDIFSIKYLEKRSIVFKLL